MQSGFEVDRILALDNVGIKLGINAFTPRTFYSHLFGHIETIVNLPGVETHWQDSQPLWVAHWTKQEHKSPHLIPKPYSAGLTPPEAWAEDTTRNSSKMHQVCFFRANRNSENCWKLQLCLDPT